MSLLATNYSLPTTRKAFTLIEMLVVITIIGILAGTSISFFYSAKNKKSAETVANEIAVKMAEAHSDAMSPSIDVTGLTAITIRYADPKIIEEYTGTSPLQTKELYTIPNNVTVTTIPSSFSFIANSGATLGSISTGNKTFTVTSKTDPINIKYTVTIDALSGNVEVSK